MREYIDDLKSIKVMSNDEAREALVLAKNGDLNAKNRLIETSLHMIYETVLSRNKKHVDDLIQDANLYLCKNILKWNPEKGKLYTFVSKFLRFLKEKHRYYQQQVYIPKHTWKQIKNNVNVDKLPKYRRMEILSARAATGETISNKLNVNSNEYSKSFFENYDEDDDISILRKLSNKLNNRERVILSLSLEGYSFVEIGKQLNIHPSRVGQLRVIMFNKIRQFTLSN